MDIDNSRSKYVVIVIVLLAIAGLVWMMLPSSQVREGIVTYFPENTEIASETQAYLAAMIPQAWQVNTMNPPRYELSFEIGYEQGTACREDSNVFLRKQITVSLRLYDLQDSVVLGEGAFTGAEAPSCEEIGIANGDIFGALPALGVLENWLITTLGTESMPALDSLERSGMSLLGTSPDLHGTLSNEFPANSFVPINSRPAYLLLATDSQVLLEECEYGLPTTTLVILRAIRSDILFQLVDMQSGELLYSGLVNGQSPRCPSSVDMSGGSQRELLGNPPNAASFQRWLNQMLEQFPQVIP